MIPVMKRCVVITLALSLIIVPFGMAASSDSLLEAKENSGALMMADALLVRPVGLVAVILGTAVFVVSLPFSALGGNTGQAAEKLIKEPAVYTFSRPLGDL